MRMEHEKPLTIAPRRPPRLVERLNLAYIDRALLASALALICFSIFTLGTGSEHEVQGTPHYFVLRQSIYAVGGLVLMLAVCALDYRRLRELRVGVYTVMIASILFVLGVGTAVRGSDRWIELPYLRVQPSELAKVLLIVSLAAFAYERARRPSGLRHTLALLALGLSPAALVLLQPDLGTAAVLAVITVSVLYFAGLPGRHFAAIAALGGVLALGMATIGPSVGVDPLRNYQQDRLTGFLHPSDDPRAASYQVNQALIAIGSGERLGRGNAATQSELLFLPERHTDFIFASAGERFGFAGAGFLLVLYAILLWRTVRVMRMSRSFYGTLVAGGILTMLAAQVIINIGMNLGVMPVTGITLPLMSYGGSSVLVSFLAIGLLQSIHVQSILRHGLTRPPTISPARKHRSRAARVRSPQFDLPAPARAGAFRRRT